MTELTAAQRQQIYQEERTRAEVRAQLEKEERRKIKPGRIVAIVFLTPILFVLLLVILAHVAPWALR